MYQLKTDSCPSLAVAHSPELHWCSCSVLSSMSSQHHHASKHSHSSSTITNISQFSLKKVINSHSFYHYFLVRRIYTNRMCVCVCVWEGEEKRPIQKHNTLNTVENDTSSTVSRETGDKRANKRLSTWRSVQLAANINILILKQATVRKKKKKPRIWIIIGYHL